MFKFEEMITPKIIGVLYAITLIITGLAIIGCIFDGRPGGAVGAFLLFIFSRVFFELLIVKFKNNEYLRDSRNALVAIQKKINADDFDMDDIVKKWTQEQPKNQREQKAGDPFEPWK